MKKAKQILDDKLDADNENQDAKEEDESSLWMTASFRNLEDVIQLSHYFRGDFEEDLVTVLYYYNNKYYLYIELAPELFEYQEDILSQVLEYSNESDITSCLCWMSMERSFFQKMYYVRYVNILQQMCNDEAFSLRMPF